MPNGRFYDAVVAMSFKFEPAYQSLQRESDSALTEPPVEFAIFIENRFRSAVEIISGTSQQVVDSSLGKIARINSQFNRTLL